jgi:hypothetical protein
MWLTIQQHSCGWPCSPRCLSYDSGWHKFLGNNCIRYVLEGYITLDFASCNYFPNCTRIHVILCVHCTCITVWYHLKLFKSVAKGAFQYCAHIKWHLNLPLLNFDITICRLLQADFKCQGPLSLTIAPFVYTCITRHDEISLAQIT